MYCFSTLLPILNTFLFHIIQHTLRQTCKMLVFIFRYVLLLEHGLNLSNFIFIAVYNRNSLYWFTYLLFIIQTIRNCEKHGTLTKWRFRRKKLEQVTVGWAHKIPRHLWKYKPEGKKRNKGPRHIIGFSFSEDIMGFKAQVESLESEVR